MNMAQSRYLTLVGHLARIYSAGADERTNCLRTGLDDIVCKIDPRDATTWQLVKQDSERLLRVWAARENTAGDSELMEQILGALADYGKICIDEIPKLVIADKAAAPPTHSILESKGCDDNDDGGGDEDQHDANESAEGSVVEPEVAPEDEEEDEEDEEDEVEGMEVDKVIIRGRSYWIDTKTKKLYAVIGDDDVGEEVGAILNGKAVFLAPK